ncbi:hypothetical protein AA313_de0203171 [Arthrobotrys entomopaga]|nr:hypothetical protein AA313_de0203171 [Arthrobotrys entomopaga]
MKTSPIRHLPVEILLEILSHLPWQAYLISSQVCTLWRDLLQKHSHSFPSDLSGRYRHDVYPAPHELLAQHQIRMKVIDGVIVSATICPREDTVLMGFLPVKEERKEYQDLVVQIDPNTHFIMKDPLLNYDSPRDNFSRHLIRCNLCVTLPPWAFCVEKQPPRTKAETRLRLVTHKLINEPNFTIKGFLDLTASTVLEDLKASSYRELELELKAVQLFSLYLRYNVTVTKMSQPINAT